MGLAWADEIGGELDCGDADEGVVGYSRCESMDTLLDLRKTCYHYAVAFWSS